MIFELHRLAEIDLTKAVRFIGSRRPGHDMLMTDDFHKLMTLLCQWPRSCVLMGHRRGNEVRRGRLHRFRYLVDYEIEPNCIFVLTVTYERRRTTPWRSRKR